MFANLVSNRVLDIFVKIAAITVFCKNAQLLVVNEEKLEFADVGVFEVSYEDALSHLHVQLERISALKLYLFHNHNF